MAPFSTVLWHTDVRSSSPIYQDTTALRKYLQQGGRLVISGWKLSTSLKFGAAGGVNTYPPGTFVPNFLKIDSTSTNGPLSQDFIEAIASTAGYPNVMVDSLRIPLFGGTLPNMDVVLLPFSDPGAEVLYTHHGKNPGSPFEGKPVAWRYLGSDFKVVVFDFPLFYMQAVTARAALRQALIDLGEPTGVGDEPVETVPTNFALHQNFPNPFNPSTSIRFDVPARSDITVTLYSLLGQEVRTLVREERPAGKYTIIWDGKNNKGRNVSSGIYFYRLIGTPAEVKTSSFVSTKKMLLVR